MTVQRVVCTSCRSEYQVAETLAETRCIVASCQTSQAPLIPSLIGENVDERYEIVSLLGIGAMSTVWLGAHVHTQKTAAVKVFNQRKGITSRDVFQHELRALALANSAHTVEVYDGGQLSDGRFYIAMEVLFGRTLRAEMDALRGTPLPLRRAIQVAEQVCMSLSCAHRHSIAHLDLKPANIMLTESGTDKYFVKLVDFGISRLIGHASSSWLSDDQTAGSPAYVSPEQLTAGVEVGTKADLYSLGVILYEMLTGSPPFQDDDPVKEALARLSRTARPLADLRPDLPLDVSRLVSALLAKDPAERPASADETRKQLISLRDAVSAPVTSLRAARPDVRGGRRTKFVVAALFALLIILCGVYLFWETSTAPPEPGPATRLPLTPAPAITADPPQQPNPTRNGIPPVPPDGQTSVHETQ
ncbi:MAG: serine/threonine protein kinase [Myxococcales bacterium]|nr:serine/threonine protein kinase [Myxococcales bacterium]